MMEKDLNDMISEIDREFIVLLMSIKTIKNLENYG